MMAVKASIANTLLGLKKAGSTSCLAPPNAAIGGLASRSLPPSPCASRKVELYATHTHTYTHLHTQHPTHTRMHLFAFCLSVCLSVSSDLFY